MCGGYFSFQGIDACMQDVNAYMQGGMNGLIVENHGDIPFLKPDKIGQLTAVDGRLRCHA